MIKSRNALFWGLNCARTPLDHGEGRGTVPGMAKESGSSVAFLRGVNVNGVTVKMTELRTTLTAIGLRDVRTVLASGNVVFEDDGAKPAERKKQIESALRATFGYDAWIVLLSASELTRIVGAFPFTRDDPDVHPYVVLGSDPKTLLTLHESAPELDPEVEAIAVGKGALYWRAPKGRSTDTPFAKVLAKKQFRESTTTRNLRTLEKVLTTT
jgi:uncharacterized protein (DUF1697 family)